MRVLLDTCVLSELNRKNGNPSVRRSVEEIAQDDLFLSVITMGEIINGISLLDDGRRKRDLQTWVRTIERDYGDHILSVDLATSRIWGELTAAARKAGRIVPASDGLIASTARRHGLHVMTRNVSDFAPTGALLLNPWVTEEE